MEVREYKVSEEHLKEEDLEYNLSKGHDSKNSFGNNFETRKWSFRTATLIFKEIF